MQYAICNKISSFNIQYPSKSSNSKLNLKKLSDLSQLEYQRGPGDKIFYYFLLVATWGSGGEYLRPNSANQHKPSRFPQL